MWVGILRGLKVSSGRSRPHGQIESRYSSLAVWWAIGRREFILGNNPQQQYRFPLHRQIMEKQEKLHPQQLRDHAEDRSLGVAPLSIANNKEECTNIYCFNVHAIPEIVYPYLWEEPRYNSINQASLRKFWLKKLQKTSVLLFFFIFFGGSRIALNLQPKGEVTSFRSFATRSEWITTRLGPLNIKYVFTQSQCGFMAGFLWRWSRPCGCASGACCPVTSPFSEAHWSSRRVGRHRSKIQSPWISLHFLHTGWDFFYLIEF